MEARLQQGYARLAAKRITTHWGDYCHPEDYGYDFREYVSPYTKGAGNPESSVMIVLQDWASHEGLVSRGVDPEIVKLGRDPSLLTNRRLSQLLDQHLGLSLSDIYATNAFVFVKPGGMSSSIPMSDVVRSAKTFTVGEVNLVRPKAILALGKLTSLALSAVAIKHLPLPHPAARISNARMNEAWETAIRRGNLSASK